MTEAKQQEPQKNIVIKDVTVTRDDKSDAHQALLDEFYRTHVVPSGYSFNARDGLRKIVAVKK